MALNVWSRLTEIRSRWTGPLTIKSPEIARHLGLDGGSSTGVPVSEWTALNYSAFWDAVSLIASDVASLPLILYKKEGKSGKTRYTDSKLYRILHDEPNPEMSSIVFRETVQAHALTWGNGYAEIERDGAGKVTALWPLMPDRMAPYRDEFGRLLYRVTNDNGTQTVFKPQDILHIPGLGYDGVVGYSVVSKARESIGLGLATERFGATFFGNGSTFGGILEHPGVMSEKAEKNFREAIASRHQGVDRAHKFLVLEENMKYQKLGIPPDEAQFLESRKFQIEEIARWFRLPPHKIGAMEHATFSNIEHQTLDYVRSCLRSWLVRWEQEYNRKLIAPSERNIQFVEHNLEGLLRGDSTARGEFYRTMFNIGAYSVNMILEKENENGIGADGDVHMAPMNMVPLNRLTDVIDAQIAPKTVQAPPPPPPTEPKPTRELDMLNELFNAAVARAEAHLAQAVAADTREAHTAEEKAAIAVERDTERQKFQTAQAEADALRAEIVLTEQRIDREKAEAEARHAEEVGIAQRAAEAQIAELASRMAALETRAQEQTDVATRAQEELVAHRDAIEVVRSALAHAEAEKEALTVAGQTRIAEWTARMAEMVSEAQAREAVVALAKDELAATKQEIDAGQAALRQVQAEKDTALATSAGVEQGLVDQIAALLDVTAALRATTKEKEDAVIQAAADLVALRALAESTASDLAVAQVEKDAAAVIVAEQQARSRELEAQIAALQAETRAREDAAALTVAELMTVRANAQATVGDLAAAEAARDAALAQIGEAIGKAQDLEARLADLQAEAERQEQATAEARAAILAAEQRADQAVQEKTVATAERDTTIARVGEVISKTLDLEQRLAETQAEAGRKEQAAVEARAAIVAAEQRAEQTVLDKTAAFISNQRNKEADRLSAMLTAHRALVVDVMGRMVRRETEKARRHQATGPKLRAWMESFYPMFEDTCVESLTPVVRAHLAWMQSVADPGAESLTIVRAYIADSRRQLSALLDSQPDDLSGSLERLLQRWEQKRPEALADRLVEEGVAYVRSYR